MNWFGIVRWCDADIAAALKEDGYALTDENIQKVRNQLEHHSFADMMIERGWEHIHDVIGMTELDRRST